MGEIYSLWDTFFKCLPEIKNKIETAAIKNGLNSESALLLIAVNNYPDINISADQNLIKVLCDKGLCEYNGNILKVTTRGTILEKSLTMTLKTF